MIELPENGPLPERAVRKVPSWFTPLFVRRLGIMCRLEYLRTINNVPRNRESRRRG